MFAITKVNGIYGLACTPISFDLEKPGLVEFEGDTQEMAVRPIWI